VQVGPALEAARRALIGATIGAALAATLLVALRPTDAAECRVESAASGGTAPAESC